MKSIISTAQVKDQKYCEIHSKYYGPMNSYKECPECVEDGEKAYASKKDYENN